jgi:hypothetical protein
MTLDIEAAKALRHAADIVQYRGVFKGAFIDPDEPPETAAVCASGALRLATGIEAIDHDDQFDRTYLRPVDHPHWSDTVFQTARAALVNAVGGSIPAWNDLPGRTSAEVISALRHTADLLDPPKRRNGFRRLLEAIPWR